MSYDPNYRPNDPPQVGSQQFGNVYGSGPAGSNQPYGAVQPYGSAHPYGSAQSYGSGQYPIMQSGPVTYGTPVMMVAQPKTNGMAGWSMWMGIIGLAGGLVCQLLSFIPIIGLLFVFVAMFLWIAPILAVIFGHIAKGQIKRCGEAGGGQATAGLVMGYISILMSIIFVIAIVALFGSLLAIFGAAGAAG